MLNKSIMPELRKRINIKNFLAFFAFFLVLVFLTFSILPVFSAGPETINLDNPIGANKMTTGEILKRIGEVIKIVLGVVGSIALLVFIYGGFLWLTSGGNPDKVKKGRDTFLWAVIGLLIIFNSYLLVDFLMKGISYGPGP